MLDRSMEKILLALSVVLLFLPSASLYQLIVDDGPLSCFECNVWKAGYGHDCNAPRNRTGCFACMKVETTIFMGYYKNTPRYSTVISRVCAKTKAVAYTSGCQYYRTVDGHSRRCYCDTNNCNAATSQTISSFLIMAVVAFVYYDNFMSVFRRSL